MLTVSGSKILINPNMLTKTENYIAWVVGHELIHIDDFLRGVFSNIRNKKELNDLKNTSERRAWHWSAMNAKTFGLGLRFKIQARNNYSRYDND